MSDAEDVADLRALRLRLAVGSRYRGPVGTVMLVARLGTSPAELLDVLVDPERHAALVKHPVALQAAAGSGVDLGPDEGDGYLMELIEGSHVTFALHPSSFPEGHYATTTFLTKANPDGGSTLTLYQQNVPADLLAEVRQAWDRDYLKPLESAYPS